MGLGYPALEAHSILCRGDGSVHCAFHDSQGISWSDGVYQWNDLLGQWEVDWWCPRPFVVCEHPLVPGSCYCGTIYGLFVSTDLSTWTELGSGVLPDNVRCLWFHPADPATLLAGTGSGLFRSSDAGATWSQDPDIPPLPVMDIAAGWDPDSLSLQVFAAVGDGSFSDGLFRSDNLGASFARINYLFRPLGLLPDQSAELALEMLTGTMVEGIIRVDRDGLVLGDLNTGLPALTVHRMRNDPFIDTPAIYACTADGLYHCLLLELNTVAVDLACTPGAGTVPFTTVMTVTMANATDQHRLEAGRIDVLLGGGQNIARWRNGFTRIRPGAVRQFEWNLEIPAQPAVIGENHFTLLGMDVTPAPYNQPPYLPSGDTDTAGCTVQATE
jgi:hypothetical protein